MSDAITVATVMSIAPTLAVLVTAWQNRRGQKDLSAKVKRVENIADGRLTEALNAIESLKKEVVRLNVEKRGTPIERPPVTMDAQDNVKVDPTL